MLLDKPEDKLYRHVLVAFRELGPSPAFFRGGGVRLSVNKVMRPRTCKRKGSAQPIEILRTSASASRGGRSPGLYDSTWA